MKNQKFMAIGGERLNPAMVSKIDQEIIAMANKKNPTVLFVPTASKDNQSYIAKFTTYFQALGAHVQLLLLYDKNLVVDQIKNKIAGADIIYIGGGNTLRMMNLWRKLGIDILLHQAWQDGKVLAGTSAGSICWFNAGNSDSRKDNNPLADYIKVTALGFIPVMHCPHYDSESDRQASLKKMMKKESGVAIALDDFAALQIIGDGYRIVTSSHTAQGYKVYWDQGVFYQELLEQINEFKPLSDLLKK